MADLSHWDFVEEFGVHQASALIAGIDPADIGIGENWKSMMPIHQRMENCWQSALRRSSKSQLSTALLSVGMEKDTGGEQSAVEFGEEKFSRKELSRWLSAIGVQSAYPFDLEKKAAIEGVNSRWPWGNHHTELLGHLDAAARKFWVHYDPKNAKRTAPKSDEVKDWLITQHKVTANMASAIATMLRPDDLPTGPRT